MVIDNGTHFLLSGNHAAISFTEAIGSRPGLRGPDEAQFRLHRYRKLASNGPCGLATAGFPWWVFDKDRRVPQTAVVDYLVACAFRHGHTADKPIGDIMKCDGPYL